MLSAEQFSICPHGVRCTEQECFYSPSHWSSSSKAPHLVIETFIAQMRSHYHDNIRFNLLQQTVPYGDGKQIIDIWGKESESSRAIALFHGGYWQEGDRRLFTSPVRALTDEGFVVACVGYDFATTISLNNVIEQATKALQFLAKRWPLKRLSVGGHSAGAHLALSALKRIPNAERYEKILLFSGIYNLHPLLETYIGKAINLSVTEAEILSVVALDEISAQLFVIVGSEESPEFKKQNEYIAENYLKKHRAMNLSDCYTIIPGDDHFTLVTNLTDRNSTTTKQMLSFLLHK